MNELAKRRMYMLVALVVAALTLGVIAFGNLGENIVYSWTPTQLMEAGDKAIGTTIRLQGMVKKGTVEQKDGKVHFVVEDGTNEMPVVTSGQPPDMFREVIGVVCEGQLQKDGTFNAPRVLVKHSAEYKAPEAGKPMDDLYKTAEGVQ